MTYARTIIQIKTTPKFDKLAKQLISADSLEDLYDFLENNPVAGDIIQGSGGVRKLRWKSGKGSR